MYGDTPNRGPRLVGRAPTGRVEEFVHAQSQLEKVAPTWMNVSLKMKEDAETDKAFGWVLEKYAYAFASALHGVHHNLCKDFMIQPPWDLKSDNTFIIHYTYGCDYSLKGELTYGKIGEWRFDKRSVHHHQEISRCPLQEFLKVWLIWVQCSCKVDELPRTTMPCI